MKEEDVGSYYTTNGEDIWELLFYVSLPTAKLRNLKTGEDVFGAIGSSILHPFKKLSIEGEIK